MTPEPACFDKARMRTELEEATATLILLYNREIEVVASGSTSEIAALDRDTQQAKAHRDALESVYRKHITEHGC